MNLALKEEDQQVSHYCSISEHLLTPHVLSDGICSSVYGTTQ